MSFYTKILAKKRIEELLRVSSIYLDINHYGEVQGIVRKAFEHKQVILGFAHTVHDKRYIAKEHIFEQGQEVALVNRINEIYKSVDHYKGAVALQIEQSSAVEMNEFSHKISRRTRRWKCLIIGKIYFTKKSKGRMEALKRRPPEKEKTTRSERINVIFNVVIGLVILFGVLFTLFRVLGGS